MNVSYPISSRPHIVWRHIDGPLLCGRHGELHWLTINERIFVCLGLDDEATLEKKHWPHIRQPEPVSEDRIADAKEKLAELFFQCARYERPSTDWVAALDAYTKLIQAEGK